MMLSLRTLLSVGVTAFVAFLILLMPARVALSLTGAQTLLTYQEARGSIWQARLLGVQVRGRPLGAVELGVSPFALLTGSLNADVRFSGAGRQGSFTLRKDKTTAVDALDMALDVNAVFGLAALNGVVTVRDGSLSYDQGRCTSGSGAVRTNILESGFAATGIQAPVLAGALGCAAGQPAYTLSGENEFVAIFANGVLTDAQRQTVDIVLTFKDMRLVTSDLRSALEFAGLSESNEGWRGRLNLDL